MHPLADASPGRRASDTHVTTHDTHGPTSTSARGPTLASTRPHAASRISRLSPGSPAAPRDGRSATVRRLGCMDSSQPLHPRSGGTRCRRPNLAGFSADTPLAPRSRAGFSADTLPAQNLAYFFCGTGCRRRNCRRVSPRHGGSGSFRVYVPGRHASGRGTRLRVPRSTDECVDHRPCGRPEADETGAKAGGIGGAAGEPAEGGAARERGARKQAALNLRAPADDASRAPTRSRRAWPSSRPTRAPADDASRAPTRQPWGLTSVCVMQPRPGARRTVALRPSPWAARAQGERRAAGFREDGWIPA